MKIKVYSLASDGDDGTRATVFGTEAELHAAMREAIEEDIDGDVTENAGAIRLLLEAGDIKAAWSDWQELITPKFFRYEKGEHEIEVELPGIGFALDACKALVSTVEATGGTVQHKDGTEGPEADPDWIDLADAYRTAKQAIALHEQSPAPTVSA